MRTRSTPHVRALAPTFERVEVIELPASVPQRGPLVVRGPAGILIEGLDLDSLVELVRRLS
ncbi:hypothetical protein [Polyangium mundeleinium]|uniref:Transposase n=1 Tax=Polyangium mundeleinium TaxID=2995306 RepID=A0ABT5EXH9_9BACT|nr:hypothetical protein [Polyangium mundeleinium]MDC0746054.1 hypothetical protein [Polyangium mundeleinium]